MTLFRTVHAGRSRVTSSIVSRRRPSKLRSQEHIAALPTTSQRSIVDHSPSFCAASPASEPHRKQGLAAISPTIAGPSMSQSSSRRPRSFAAWFMACWVMVGLPVAYIVFRCTDPMLHADRRAYRRSSQASNITSKLDGDPWALLAVLREVVWFFQDNSVVDSDITDWWDGCNGDPATSSTNTSSPNHGTLRNTTPFQSTSMFPSHSSVADVGRWSPSSDPSDRWYTQHRYTIDERIAIALGSGTLTASLVAGCLLWMVA